MILIFIQFKLIGVHLYFFIEMKFRCMTITVHNNTNPYPAKDEDWKGHLCMNFQLSAFPNFLLPDWASAKEPELEVSINDHAPN